LGALLSHYLIDGRITPEVVSPCARKVPPK
jgi:hypothetical protein